MGVSDSRRLSLLTKQQLCSVAKASGEQSRHSDMNLVVLLFLVLVFSSIAGGMWVQV